MTNVEEVLKIKIILHKLPYLKKQKHDNELNFISG